MFRIGNGIDFHKLVRDPDRPMYLGGYHVDTEYTLLGHSDADLLLHSITDAILGALALGDIGEHYPNTDASIKNIASSKMLKSVLQMAREKGWEIVNVDSTIIAELPKISPIKQKIRESMKSILEIPLENISVKATTMEGMGTLGRAEGMMCMSTILLEKK